MASSASRPVRSTPWPSRTISIRRTTSTGIPPSSFATSNRIELVPQSIAATTVIPPPPREEARRRSYRLLRGPHPMYGSQVQQHPGVAERVRLDPLQVQELGHALVVGAQQLLV